jgi:hypothetical protein
LNKPIRIGGASGYWGDASIATPQLLAAKNLDYLVYDYLAEITLSIMARARISDPQAGYAKDFVCNVIKPHIKTIAARGIKVIANAGGVNPQACGKAIVSIIEEYSLDLKVAVISGDDLLQQKHRFVANQTTEMFSGQPFPDPQQVASINAYLGAFPIAKALDLGADIVITGRCVDSAVTLGVCIHAFGWQPDELDRLAQGGLAGHLLECGTQVSGGNFTDWQQVVDSLPTVGYPIAEIDETGEFCITKPDHTGGVISLGTVAEQMLYEIANPQAYTLPDVICDFSEVTLTQHSDNKVAVSGAKGVGVPSTYKVSTTYADGFRAGQVFTYYGRHAAIKAQKFADNVLSRTRFILDQLAMEDLSQTSIEVIGSGAHYGNSPLQSNAIEVDVKIAVTHHSAKGAGIFLKEAVGMALSSPPGLTLFAGSRPKPSPVIRLFSTLVPKSDCDIRIDIVNHHTEQFIQTADLTELEYSPAVHEIPEVNESKNMQQVPLELLAWARSGDKGNKANIGVIARKAAYLPFIARSLTSERVANIFAHFLNEGSQSRVDRYYLPGSHSLNFVLHDVLGGGGIASLRTDAQGKGYAQILLAENISIPRNLIENTV